MCERDRTPRSPRPSAQAPGRSTHPAYRADETSLEDVLEVCRVTWLMLRDEQWRRLGVLRTNSSGIFSDSALDRMGAGGNARHETRGRAVLAEARIRPVLQPSAGRPARAAAYAQ